MASVQIKSVLCAFGETSSEYNNSFYLNYYPVSKRGYNVVENYICDCGKTVSFKDHKVHDGIFGYSKAELESNPDWYSQCIKCGLKLKYEQGYFYFDKVVECLFAPEGSDG